MYVHICILTNFFQVTNSNDSKDPEFFDAQNGMLTHLANSGLAVPVPVPNKHGEFKSLEELEVTPGVMAKYMVRVLIFVPGKIFYDVDPWKPEHFFQVRPLFAIPSLPF